MILNYEIINETSNHELNEVQRIWLNLKAELSKCSIGDLPSDGHDGQLEIHMALKEALKNYVSMKNFS